MLKHFYLIYWCVFIICCLTDGLYAQLSVTADRFNASYELGETMYFNVTADASGIATYTLKYGDDSPLIASGEITITAGEITSIPFKSSEPSFILCDVEMSGDVETAAAVFAPYDIVPFEEEPSDFDAFWDNQKMELRSIAMEEEISFYEETDLSRTYRINLANVEDRRVYGYLSIPKGEGTYPAIVVMPSFGSAANHVRAQDNVAEHTGCITLAVNIHDVEPDREDPNAYEPNHFDVREENYYRQALLGAVRMIDYIFTMPEFDGQNLAVMGTSQGGGLSLCMSGLDERITLLVNNIPALCQHTGLHYGRASGHPHYLDKAKWMFPEAYQETVVRAIKYYDAVYFAKRFKGSSVLYTSYEDTTCPPATVFAANNQLVGKRVIFHRRDEEHTHSDYRARRFDFIRRHFNTQTLRDDENTKGYYADVGTDRVGTINTPINLMAMVENNDLELSNLKAKWMKVDGPGQVTFSNPNAYTTTAFFSVSGTYLIRFLVIDDDFPTEDAKWVTVMDFLEVVIE